MKPQPSQPADPAAVELEALYARLRRIAGKMMASERAGHTMWPTEVVHEAIARLLESRKPEEAGSLVDFVSHTSHVMRQVLVDHARRRNSIKRGGGRGRVSLDEIDDLETAIDSPHFDWAALDRAMDELAKNDERRHRVVMLRFFGGLDNRQIARQLGLDERTVGRDWAAARLWLKKQLHEA